MSFNSFHFLAFFPIVLCLYFVLPYRFRTMFLLLAGLYFYAVWRPPYILQLLAVIWLSYYAGIKIEEAADASHKKRYLFAAIALLTGNLFVFKYFNFFNDSFRSLFQSLGLAYQIPAIHLLLPIGISFYTFQKLSYLIDVYNGSQKAERDFPTFALYASFFPQLVAGPIERAANLLPQFHQNHDFDYRRVTSGLQLMAWGFFKKVMVADRLAPFVQQVYNNPREHDGVGMAIATLLFAFQVYCDFSGYTDIAIGAAQTMGYNLMRNFNHPYFAISIQDFWKRWHISLSSWLSDYIYTPLTRLKFLKLKWYHMILLSLFTTFVVSGLWHGAQWTFVLWGALHGAYLVSSMLTQKLRRKTIKLFRLDRVPKVHYGLRMFFTFVLVCFSYVLFRANNLSDAMYIFTHLPTGWGHVLTRMQSLLSHGVESILALGGIAVVILVEILQLGGASLRMKIAARPAWVRWSLYYAVAVSVIMFGAFYSDAQKFIYFQF
jgi:alginate O-acetyltransferase complex protein AlgI